MKSFWSELKRSNVVRVGAVQKPQVGITLYISRFQILMWGFSTLALYPDLIYYGY